MISPTNVRMLATANNDTPNSVSFNVVAVYTFRTNDVGGKERGARTFNIRLYRDNTKSEWKNG